MKKRLIIVRVMINERGSNVCECMCVYVCVCACVW